MEGLFAGVREQAHMIKEVAKAHIAALEMEQEVLEMQRIYEQQGEKTPEAQEAVQRKMLEKGKPWNSAVTCANSVSRQESTQYGRWGS